MQGTVVEHAGIGVQATADATLTLTKHRKIASSFQDVHLYEIFQLSCFQIKDR